MLGLDEMRTLAHAMEDVLDGVRETGEFPVELAGTLLRAVDALRLQSDGRPEGVADLFAELEERRHRPRSVAPPAQADRPRSASRDQAGVRAIRVPAEKIDRAARSRGRDRCCIAAGSSTCSPSRGRASRRGRARPGRAAARRAEGRRDRRCGRCRSRRSPGRCRAPCATWRSPRASRPSCESSGIETELDRVILESLSDPLVHLLRNAVAHGIEAPEARERVRQARHGPDRAARPAEGRLVEIVVADDGRGVSRGDARRSARASARSPRCSPRPASRPPSEVTGLSGRGVGLDAVKRQVESFGGSLEVRSEPGHGTRSSLRAAARARADRRAARRARRAASSGFRLQASRRRLGRRAALAGGPAVDRTCATKSSRSPISPS